MLGGLVMGLAVCQSTVSEPFSLESAKTTMLIYSDKQAMPGDNAIYCQSKRAFEQKYFTYFQPIPIYEIKGQASTGTVEAALGNPQGAIILSGDEKILHQIGLQAPHLQLIYRFEAGCGIEDLAQLPELLYRTGAKGVALESKYVYPDLVDTLSSQGIPLMALGVGTPIEKDRLTDLGVRLIVADPLASRYELEGN